MKATIYDGEHGMWTMEFADGSAIRGCKLDAETYETRAFHRDGTLGPTFRSKDARQAEHMARVYLRKD